MRFHPKNMIVTAVLLCLLILVIIVELFIFVIGPNQKYEHDIAVIENKITNTYKYIQTVDRNVFHFTTYTGISENTYYWFDEEGKLLMRRNREEDRQDEVKEKASKDHNMKDVQVTLGYGYKNAVYIVKTKQEEVYYDFDSLKEVYYREGNI